MKVILLQDVAKIGRRFDIANVPDGYALNKLIPQKLAKPATPANIKGVEAQAKKTQVERDKQQSTFVDALKEIKGKVIEVVADTNEEGRMFQALKVDAIIEAAKTGANVVLVESNFHISKPIKETGQHTITLVSGDDRGELSLNVISKK